MKMKPLFSLLLVVHALVPCWAAEVEVADVAALAEALSAASPGDTVELADGVYCPTETIVVPAGVTLRSKNGREHVIFTQGGGGIPCCPVVEAADVTSVIEGLTFSNFVYTAVGSVVSLEKGGKLASCRVTRCTLAASNYGGSVVCGKGAVVSRSVIDDNRITGTAGQSALGCAQSVSGDILVEDTLVYGNDGALIARSGTWAIRRCTFADNLNLPYMSAFSCYKRNITFTDCAILSSTSPGLRDESRFWEESMNVTFSRCYVPALLSVVPKAAEGCLTSGDVKFANPQAGDYRPLSGSALVGAATGGGDIGCFAFDAAYEPTHPVVELASGADLAAAVASAGEGTVIRLAAGEYPVAAPITVDKPLRVVGAGRDRSVLRSDGDDHRVIKINHHRAVVEGVTVTGARCSAIGGAVWIGALGGCLADSRVTGNVALGVQGTVAVGCCGVVYGCTIDDNAYAKADGTVGTAEGCAGVNFWKGDSERDVYPSGLIDLCLIVNNRGYSIYLNNGNTPTQPNVVQRSTVVGERGYLNVVDTRGFASKRTIYLAATEKPFREIASVSGSERQETFTNCFFRSLSGTNVQANDGCVTADDPLFVNPRAGDYRLRAGSPCIGAAEDGSDIGCFAYSPDETAEIPTVRLSGGDDLAAAVAAAADGADILLVEGVYELAAALTVSRPVRIVGASRDGVFIQPTDGSGPFRLLTLAHPLARVENVTLRRAPGGAVALTGGGVVEGCRITECVAGATKTDGLAAFLAIGHLNRCLVDGNADSGYNRDTSFVDVRSDIPNSNFLTFNFGLLENTLVTGNRAASGTNVRGSAVYVHRQNVAHGGLVRGVTVIGNSLKWALDASSYVNQESEIVNSIFWGSPVAYGGTKAGAIRACVLDTPNEAAARYAADSRAIDPLVRSNGKLKRGSPCIGAAAVLPFAAGARDYAGNPRVAEDGTQDIGCLQHTAFKGCLLILR